MIVVETNVDDMPAEATAHLTTMLLSAGARDVWTTAAGMKKCRMGCVISALCLPQDTDRVLRLFFTHSTTIGVRQYPVARASLPRRFESFSTPYGEVSVKVSSLDGQAVTVKPEFEDCALLSAQHKVPIARVRAAAESLINAKYFDDATSA